jgi:hypothetical protein
MEPTGGPAPALDEEDVGAGNGLAGQPGAGANLPAQAPGPCHAGQDHLGTVAAD